MLEKSSGSLKSFWCRRCQKRIRLYKGWGAGSSARRHYWVKHPEVMRPRIGRGR